MNKNEIILARIISTTSASALALLILVAGIRSNYFSQIANQINNNTLSGEGANLYNYYYYSGLQVIYEVLFTVTVISLIVAIVSILFRLQNCQLVCTISAMSAIVTSLFLLFGRVYESSVGVHRFIAGFYMGNVAGSDIVTAQYLSKIPIWTILFLVVSVILFFLVRVTKFGKIKLYHKGGCDGLHLLLSGLYGSLMIGLVRRYVMNGMTSAMDDANRMSYTYVREYFIAERWLLSVPFVVYAAIAVILTVALNHRVNKMLHRTLSIGVPTLIAGIIGIYYFINPARIFGRLTLDEHVCDITEAAMSTYLIQMIVAVGFITVLVFYTYMKLSIHKILIVMLVNAVASLIFMFLGMAIGGLPGIYIGGALTDMLGAGFVIVFSNWTKNKTAKQKLSD
ncbi:MAG: hypothetical protein PHW47_08765 [Lachnospira sp.]|nr:hypothetical protein [Lachnospira sp.]